MLEGNNTMTLNHATICKAVAHWLNTRLLTDDAAVDVKLVQHDRTCGANDFVITVTPKEKTA